MWVLEVAISLEALQLLTSITVGSKCSCLKAISDVREICDPSKVNGNGIEGDKETGEKEERNGHDRS